MKTLKAQFNILFKRKSFYISLFTSLVYAIVSFAIKCVQSYGREISYVFSASEMYLGSKFSQSPAYVFLSIIPVLAILPFSDTYFEERQLGISQYCLTRSGEKKYYFSKLTVVFFSGFIVIFSALMINYLLCLTAFPFESTYKITGHDYFNSPLYTDMVNDLLFSSLFASNMYLYNFVYMLITSTASGLMAVIVYQISFFYKKNRAVLLCGFYIIYNAADMLVSSFGLRHFTPENNLLAGDVLFGQTYAGFAVFCGALILGALLPIPFALKKLRNSYA